MSYGVQQKEELFPDSHRCLVAWVFASSWHGCTCATNVEIIDEMHEAERAASLVRMDLAFLKQNHYRVSRLARG